MNISEGAVKKFVSDVAGLKKKLENLPFHQKPNREELCQQYAEKFKVSELTFSLLLLFHSYSIMDPAVNSCLKKSKLQWRNSKNSIESIN